MRRLILGTLGLLLLAIPGRAQEAYPKAEAFGGFSISSISAGPRNTLYGWQASANGNLHRSIGIVGDFGGQYKSVAGVGFSNYQYLFGPRFSMRQEKVTPFAHALLGADRASVGGLSNTKLALGFGGGLDLNISDRLALRVPQFDWTPVHGGGVWTTNVIRIGFGLVFKAGE